MYKPGMKHYTWLALECRTAILANTSTIPLPSISRPMNNFNIPF